MRDGTHDTSADHEKVGIVGEVLGIFTLEVEDAEDVLVECKIQS